MGERRHAARGVLLGDVAEHVADETDGFPRAVGALDELAGGVIPVGQHPSVEVGLPDQVPGRVVVVPPDESLRVGDRDQPQLGVVGEGQPRPVRTGPRRRQVEVRGLGAGHQPGRVDVLDKVALPVVGPPLDGAARQRAGSDLALHRPGEPGHPTDRVGHGHHPAEDIPVVGGDRAERIGHRDRQAGGVGGDPPGVAERVGDGREPAAVVMAERRPRAGRVNHGGQVAPVVVGAFPAGAIRFDEGHRQPQVVPLRAGPAAVRPEDLHQVAVGVVGVQDGAAQRVGLGELAVVPVPLIAGGMTERVDLPLQLHRVGEVILGGVPQRVGLHRDAASRVVGDGPVEATGGARGAHHPAGLVVGVGVLGAVAVRPADHAPGGVVVEPQRPARGVDDLGEPSARVVAVPDDLGVQLPCLPAHPHGCDQPLAGLHHQLVPTRMVDLGERAVVGVVAQLNAVAVAVTDRGERQGHVTGAVGRDREAQGVPGRRVGDGVRAVLVAGQRQARALGRQHGFTGRRMRVGQQHPIRRGIAHPRIVDLKPVIQRRAPRRAEPAARPVRRHVGALQRPGQQTGQLEVDLLQDHLPVSHVHRITPGEPAVRGTREVPRVVQCVPDGTASSLDAVGYRRDDVARLTEGCAAEGAQSGADELHALAVRHLASQPGGASPQPGDADDTPPARNETEDVQAELS